MRVLGGYTVCSKYLALGLPRTLMNPNIGGAAAAKTASPSGATLANRPIKEVGFHAAGTAGNPRALTYFHSLGPTGEHRLKPNVVAPGLPILSVGSRHTSITP
jgi:hypothetical protein